MKLGLDIGSSDLKTNLKLTIPSKIKRGSSLSPDAIIVEFDGITYTIGEGNREVDVNKGKRKFNLIYIYTLIALSTDDVHNSIGVGLPIGQYSTMKKEYRDFIMANNHKTFKINGKTRTIIIDDVTVFPEGLASIPEGFNGIICDIGGKTTDIALIDNRKVLHPVTKPRGILDLFSAIVNEANTRYVLDMQQEEGLKVLSNFKIEGCYVDNQFARDIMAEFVDDVVNTLNLTYSLKTNDFLITGGGAIICEKAFKKRVRHTQILEQAAFSNALAFWRGIQ